MTLRNHATDGATGFAFTFGTLLSFDGIEAIAHSVIVALVVSGCTQLVVWLLRRMFSAGAER